MDLLLKDDVLKIFVDVFEKKRQIRRIPQCLDGEVHEKISENYAVKYGDFCWNLIDQESVDLDSGKFTIESFWEFVAEKMERAYSRGFSAKYIDLMLDEFMDIVYDDEDSLFRMMDLLLTWDNMDLIRPCN